jgi:hypothetical protein
VPISSHQKAAAKFFCRACASPRNLVSNSYSPTGRTCQPALSRWRIASDCVGRREPKHPQTPKRPTIAAQQPPASQLPAAQRHSCCEFIDFFNEIGALPLFPCAAEGVPPKTGHSSLLSIPIGQ